MARYCAYVEMWCEHAGIVRGGPNAHHFPDQYEYALAFTVRDGWATFQGLYFTIPPDAVKAAARALNAEGLKVRWERRKNGVVRVVEIA